MFTVLKCKTMIVLCDLADVCINKDLTDYLLYV